MAKTLIKVQAKQTTSNANALRDFSRRVRDAGIINKVRSLRFYEREHSNTIKKKDALKKIQRREEVKKLIKLGKMRDTRAKKVEIKSAQKESGKK